MTKKETLDQLRSSFNLPETSTPSLVPQISPQPMQPQAMVQPISMAPASTFTQAPTMPFVPVAAQPQATAAFTPEVSRFIKFMRNEETRKGMIYEVQFSNKFLKIQIYESINLSNSPSSLNNSSQWLQQPPTSPLVFLQFHLHLPAKFHSLHSWCTPQHQHRLQLDWPHPRLLLIRSTGRIVMVEAVRLAVIRRTYE